MADTSLQPGSARFLDAHCHAGLDERPRRTSVIGLGHEARRARGWVVVKSHLGSTASSARQARALGLPVSGSVTLNPVNGGVHWRHVERAVQEQGLSPLRLIAYLPTRVSIGHMSADSAASSLISDGPKLREEVLDVLAFARDHDIVVATGHASRREVELIVAAAHRLGVPRLIITHPLLPSVGFDPSALLELCSAECAYAEVTALGIRLGRHDAITAARVLRELPGSIFTSDFGQPESPTVRGWLDESDRYLSDGGLDAAAIETVRRINPLQLLAVAAVDTERKEDAHHQHLAHPDDGAFREE